MSVCAGSSTERLFPRGDRQSSIGSTFAFPAVGRPGRKGEMLRLLLRFFPRESALAGQVRMDLEPGRTRVHEHAETGKPPPAWKAHGRRERIEPHLARIHRVVRPCNGRGWNGPGGRDFAIAHAQVGHKLSAIGSPQHTAGPPRCLPPGTLRAARPGCTQRAQPDAGDWQVIPPAYPRTFRSRLSPSVPSAQRFPR